MAAALLVIAFLAEVVGTIAGFGSSTLFLPFALFFVDFPTALILVACFHIFGNLGRIAFFRHGLDTRLLLLFGIPSVLFTVLGALLIGAIPQEMLKLALGIFLLLFSIASLAKPGFAFQPSSRHAVIGGSLSGFLAGLIGTGGALRGAFLTSFRLQKERYIATAAAIALAVDITRIPIYLGSGFLDPQFYSFLPLLLVIAIAGSYAGKRIVVALPQQLFRKIVLAALAAVSLKLVYDGILFF